MEILNQVCLIFSDYRRCTDYGYFMGMRLKVYGNHGVWKGDVGVTNLQMKCHSLEVLDGLDDINKPDSFNFESVVSF